MTTEHEYADETLLETLKESGAPRILTTRKDGTVVYVALGFDEEHIYEVDPDDD